MTLQNRYLSSPSILCDALQIVLMRELRSTLLHELKGPLHTISTATQMLKRISQNPRTADTEALSTKCFGWIESALKDLPALTDSLLPRDRAEVKGEADIASIVAAAVALVRVQASVRGINFELKNSEQPIFAAGNAEQLTTSIRALIFGLMNLSADNSVVTLDVQSHGAAIDMTMHTSARRADQLDWADAFAIDLGRARPLLAFGLHAAKVTVEANGGGVDLEQGAAQQMVQQIVVRFKRSPSPAIAST